MCGSNSAGPSPRCAAPHSLCRAQSSGACPPWPAPSGGRRSVTACSSTTTRTRRTAPPAPRIPCARFPTPACPRRFTGMRSPTATRPISPCSPFPKRFAELGDPHADMDAAARFAREAARARGKRRGGGLGDAPWPPHFRKMEGEAPRVAPSRARSTAKKPRRSQQKVPLLVVANSPDKEAALAGLERWKSRHPEVAKLLAVDDVLVDSMRGRSSTWTRIRVNLRNVPEALRPPQETPDPDDDPTREWRDRRASKQEQG